jgi:NADH dehydrogenase
VTELERQGTILVAGATGHLGGLVARRCLAQGSPVRVLVRRGSDHRELQAAGAEIAFGDLKNPASLEAACRGVDRVVSTVTAAARGGADTVETVDREGYRHFIAAARGTGVEQFVFVSAYGFGPDAPVALARAKAATEEELRESGVGYTILRPVLFMEAWIGLAVGGQLAGGDTVTVVGDADLRHAFVALRNVGDLCLAVLGHPEAQNAVIPLASESASYREIVERIAVVSGRDLKLRSVEPGTRLEGAPPIVSELWAFLAREAPMDVETPEVVRRFDLSLLTVEDYLRETFGSGR